MSLRSIDKPAVCGGVPVFAPPLPFNKPTLPSFDSVRDEIEEVMRSGQLTNGLNVRALEEQAAEIFGRPAVAVASCTAGLMLTAKALGLTGEVIVPSFTFFATTHALIWNGIKPRFADISVDTWNLDPAAVSAALTPAVSAILAVDVFGNPGEKEALELIAKENSLTLVTDAAHALGAESAGRPVGSFGDAEVFSLSPTKTVAAGEGGLVSVADEAVGEMIRQGRDYGNSGDYDCRFVGLNARMPEINAILARKGMDVLPDIVARRGRIQAAYRENLAELPGLAWQVVKKGNTSSSKDISVLVDEYRFGMSRDALARALEAEGIPTRTYFSPPAHEQTAYKGLFSAGDLTVTDRVSSAILNLPVFSHMGIDQVDKVCAAVKRIVAHRSSTGG